MTVACKDGEWSPFELRLSVARGWHFAPLGGATDRVLAISAEGAEIELVDVPEPVELPLEGSPRGLEGEVAVTGRWRARREGGAGPKLRVRYQVCGEGRCLPETTLELDFGG